MLSFRPFPCVSAQAIDVIQLAQRFTCFRECPRRLPMSQALPVNTLDMVDVVLPSERETASAFDVTTGETVGGKFSVRVLKVHDPYPFPARPRAFRRRMSFASGR